MEKCKKKKKKQPKNQEIWGKEKNRKKVGEKTHGKKMGKKTKREDKCFHGLELKHCFLQISTKKAP